ncbi:MAG: RNA polymerase sigma factor [Gaiellales bacterium]
MQTRFDDHADRTDAETIERSLREPAAFGEVFERHFGSVHAYAQRRAGAELADDVAAETFVQAFARRRRYDLIRPDARPWLLGIATNVLHRHWRTERRRLRAYERSLDPAGDAEPAAPAGLLAVVAKLPRRDRDALLLYAWADLSYEEIALALDCPVGTVRSRIARARRLLQAALAVDRPLRPAPEPSKEASRA